MPEEVPRRCQHIPTPAEVGEKLTDWLGDQPWQNVLLVVLWHGGDDGGEWRYIVDPVLLCKLGADGVEVDVLSGTCRVLGGLMVFYQGAGDVCAAPEEALVLWGEV